MKLEKATIKNLTKEETIRVLFNPTQYQVTETNQFAEIGIPGVEAPPLQFVRGAARTLSMQLFFDTYDPDKEDPEQKKVTPSSDVRLYTKKIISLLRLDSESHAPPICSFNWADFTFIGVVERADQRFTLFLPNGTPVRATIDVSMKELGQHKANQGRRLFSADFIKSYVVKRGDTLSRIAGEKLGDPARWRLIAEANGLDNPLALKPGQALVIPPDPEKNGSQ